MGGKRNILGKGTGGVVTPAPQATDRAATTEELRARLANFVMDYLDVKVQEGITYVLLLNDKKNEERFKEMAALRMDLSRAGYADTQLFRCYDCVNGHIFDVDLKVARDITVRLAKAALGVEQDLIGNGPERRRTEDIERLARSCRSWFNKGIEQVEVALFSRNSVPRINITGKDGRGQPKLVTYEAYAVRHWDIDTVNQLLLRHGIRIHQVDTHEILPPETGLRVTLHIGIA